MVVSREAMWCEEAFDVLGSPKGRAEAGGGLFLEGDFSTVQEGTRPGRQQSLPVTMLASVENSLLGQLPLSTVFHQVMESGRAGSAEVLTS